MHFAARLFFCVACAIATQCSRQQYIARCRKRRLAYFSWNPESDFSLRREHVTRVNRPILSCFEPHYDQFTKLPVARSIVFVIQVSFLSYTKKTNFQKKRFGLSLTFIMVFKQLWKGLRVQLASQRRCIERQSTEPGKMATGTFTRNTQCTKILQTLLKTHRKVPKPLNLAYTQCC